LQIPLGISLADNNHPGWFEVSLVVDGELAEAVADVLARFAPTGVVIESTEVKDSDDSQGEIIGPLRVCAYIIADHSWEDVKQKIEESLWYLGSIQALPPTQFKKIQQENWMENWKQHFNPIEVGEKFVIVPIWHTNPNPERIEIKMDPGMAFGTGTHPTTQLSLSLLEKYLSKNDNVFDVGCGSGILSVGAIKLGAKAAYGTDIDVGSIKVAKKIGEMNLVQESTHFEMGSVEEFQSEIFPINKAEIVVANILTPILIKLLNIGMGELVTSDGKLLLSGILDIKLDEITNCLHNNGFKIIEKITDKDWVGIAAIRI
jgi:ribosomal protein L11 methyltransferase